MIWIFSKLILTFIVFNSILKLRVIFCLIGCLFLVVLSCFKCIFHFSSLERFVRFNRTINVSSQNKLKKSGQFIQFLRCFQSFLSLEAILYSHHVSIHLFLHFPASIPFYFLSKFS